MRRANFLAVVVLLICASGAGAETLLQVDVGWGNFYRASKWAPMFVTMSDAAPRAVDVEVESPNGRYAMTIHQGVTIGQRPVTIPIYAPLAWSLWQTSVTVRGTNGRTLAYETVGQQPGAMQAGRRDPVAVGADQLFVGLSGTMSTERLVESQFGFTNTMVGYLPPERLPAVPAGYDSLDVLLLNQPDLNRIADDQQRAIVSWVRSGGKLVIWPGAEPIPATSPIVDALPCRIGSTETIEIDPRIVKSAGLPTRFKSLTVRPLTPLPGSGAAEVKLLSVFSYATTRPATFAKPPVAYRGRAGFGQIVVLPVDASLLRFDTPAHTEAFWRRQLEGVVEIPHAEVNNNNYRSAYPYYSSGTSAREQQAISRALDQLGNIPGAGAFGFSYIAGVLALMMVLVGPVDWFVLKMLRRQPWTWATTAGWAGLITVGAIFVGHLFKSGDLHFRTMSVIDEADGSRVAVTDVASIYSPRTTDYEIECDPESWWKPATDQVGWSSSTLQIDVPCHQDYHGNRLLPLSLNVWNLRYIEGVTYATEPAMLDAKLLVKVDKQVRKRVVNGTITNHSKMTLRNILVRTSDGVAKVSKGELGPNETATINSIFESGAREFNITPEAGTPYYPGRGPLPVPNGATKAALVGDLAADRSMAIEKLMVKYRDAGCVYAEFDAAPGTVKLANEMPKELHSGVLRSLVRIERE